MPFGVLCEYSPTAKADWSIMCMETYNVNPANVDNIDMKIDV